MGEFALFAEMAINTANLVQMTQRLSHGRWQGKSKIDSGRLSASDVNLHVGDALYYSVYNANLLDNYNRRHSLSSFITPEDTVTKRRRIIGK